MAHKKAGGSKANQGTNVIGKRLGVKKYAGEVVNPGDIIIRQRGTQFHPGAGVKIGRDYTIFSTSEGVVSVRNKKGGKFIDVLSAK